MTFIGTFDELNKLYEENSEKKQPKLEEACSKNKLAEAADEEELEIVDDEPKQTIIECSKCGALVIVDEIEVDEESDLVNIKDKCKFCEEKEGYKIVGSVVPYETAEEPVVEEEPVEADEFEDEIADEDLLDEDLADWFRSKLDKPASIATQQAWEDELNGEMGEISDKRRKHLENKFKQQRDWEARHPDKVNSTQFLTPNKDELDEGIFDKKDLTVEEAERKAINCSVEELQKGDIIVGAAYSGSDSKEGLYNSVDKFKIVKKVEKLDETHVGVEWKPVVAKRSMAYPRINAPTKARYWVVRQK